MSGARIRFAGGPRIRPTLMALVGSLSALAASVWAFPQEPASRFSVDVNAVALDVVVTDQKGRFVKGLAEGDFLVLEDGIPQELSYFTSAATPVTVLLLLDSSSSVRSHLREVQKAANRFIDKLERGDQARIGLFHSEVLFGPSFTDDMKQHMAMIKQMRPQRSTLLYDAVLAALDELAMISDRRALLIFTDGDDGGSQASLEDALEAARRSRATIYTVGLLGWNDEEGMNTNERLLTQIAEYTGGRAFFPADEDAMNSAFDRIQDELHRQYRMVYFPKDSETRGDWHDIEVRMSQRSNLVVRTRLGYYSGPDRMP
jgi:Ca-activated chloride channel family protein